MRAPYVLVVDDVADLRLLASLRVRETGFDVREAATAEEALQMAAESPPVAVLIDMHLAGEDSLALISELRTRLAETKIIATSASATEDEMAPPAVAAGADAFCDKAGGFASLGRELRRLLNRPTP